ncbi:MarR family winged helix-turn-helix transcriptional regulator [Bacillus sp. NPDC077411]|uniref:MarR family transcriptional regulator n=1 Tax=Bacillus bruguierae TaxID=3127667 RepID=A0ABU8FIZ9_9BACI
MRKNGKGTYSDDTLPRLGIHPYLDLINHSASSSTNRNDASMGLIMLWLSDNILDVMDQELAQFGITESKLDLLILITLHDNKVITPSAIAERLGIRRASATSMIDWLEKRNLVTRKPSSFDRRKIYVSITEEGRTFVEKVLPTYWSVCASIFDELDPTERQVFEKIIKKLNENMQVRLGVGR